jgi:hypothetical protein
MLFARNAFGTKWSMVQMKPIFYLASAVFGIDGLIHIVKVGSEPVAEVPLATIITALFGILCLVIAFFLARRYEAALTAGLVLALLGLLLNLLEMQPNPDVYTRAFIGLDLVAAAICAYLLYAGRVRLGRVR